MKILPRKNDILFAHKALNIIPGLSESCRRVAGAIVDHFNKKNGRCYPGVGRICKMLGLDRATVLRATKKLNEMKIITKESHGGPSHQASYQPNWAYLRVVVKEWDELMKVFSQDPTADIPTDFPEAEKVKEGRRSRSQNCDVGCRKSMKQSIVGVRPSFRANSYSHHAFGRVWLAFYKQLVSLEVRSVRLVCVRGVLPSRLLKQNNLVAMVW